MSAKVGTMGMCFENRRGAARTFGLVGAMAAMGVIGYAALNGVHVENKTTLSGSVPTESVPVAVEAPKPSDHFTLNLSSAFNGFVGETWKRENHDDDGIPSNGRVLVPGVVPRAYFQFVPPDDPNAIQLSAGTPITVAIPEKQRGHYGRLAFLHGSPKSNVAVKTTLHYDSGADVVEELRVQDWNRIDDAKETNVYKSLKAGRIQLFSQIFKLDLSRKLESVTFLAEASADIFALTVIVSADRPFNGATGMTVPSRESMQMDDQKK